MDKLLELEKRLREAQAELSKIMSSGTKAAGSVNTTGGPSIASQIGFGKAEEEEKKKKKHEDEKEDKELIDSAINEHEEDMHKDGKSLHKAKLAFDANKLADKLTGKQTVSAPRQDAVDIDPQTGDRKSIPAEAQVKAQAGAADSKKATAESKRAKFEEEAKARRADYRKQGLIKFDKNGQWKMEDEE